MAFNGTGRALNETVFSGNSAEQDAADTSPVASAMGNLGKSFGIGSAIAAGIGLLAGYMGLESPMLGMGLAAVGAFVGQPIFDAISSSMNTPAPPVSGQAVDKAPVKAPAQEQSPTLSPEAKQQAEAARNNAVSGGQTAATSAAQTIPAPAQSTATAPSVP